MIFAIEISDNVDLTALGTIALAALTLTSLSLARRALGQTRRGIEAAYRPILVPVIDHTRRMTLPDGQLVPAIPTPAGNRIIVPVQNIGPGPALEVEMGLTYPPQTFGKDYDREHTMSAPGIGTGHIASLELPLVGAPGGPFDLRLSYRDVGRNRWVTTASHKVGMATRYEKLLISHDVRASRIRSWAEQLRASRGRPDP